MKTILQVAFKLFYRRLVDPAFTLFLSYILLILKILKSFLNVS